MKEVLYDTWLVNGKTFKAVAMEEGELVKTTRLLQRARKLGREPEMKVQIVGLDGSVRSHDAEDIWVADVK